MREPMPDCAPVGSSPTMAPVSAMATATFSDANRNGTAAGKRSFHKTCETLAL